MSEFSPLRGWATAHRGHAHSHCCPAAPKHTLIWCTWIYTNVKIAQSRRCLWSALSSHCQPDLEISTPFMYSLWLKLSPGDCRPLKHDIHSCQRHCKEPPMTPSRQLKGYTPPSAPFISHKQPLPPNQKCHWKTPRRRAGATISAHVNMQHLQLRCCKSPLKVARLPRHTGRDRSLSESASALSGEITMGHHARVSMDLT